ncbi:T-cell immunoglobulin and mucin domain-containing protein 2-like isoform X2 [Aquarana catesbeiana]|uniref:T-cell immunoglobulin and mucin domain-containing protein 2-like isoform X2 n=1 Tax=Aquarana catesbeiana TaxID=8400 RepID=UPI003CC9940A
MGLFSPLTLLLTGLLWLCVLVFTSAEDTVTIPCSYTVHQYQYSVCWGRGSCPSFSCNNLIFKTGDKETWRKADKYQLMGDIEKGDVSLTISGVTMEDAGTYCCRVEIPGWFNDLKSNIDLEIQEDEPKISQVYSPEGQPRSALTKIVHKIKKQIHEEEVTSNPPTLLTDFTQSPTRANSNLTFSPTGSSPLLQLLTQISLHTMTHHKPQYSLPFNTIRATIILGLTLLLLIIFCTVKKNKGQDNVIL